MTTLLDQICRNADLLAAFRARPQQTLLSLGAALDDPEIEQMQLLEDDAVSDVVFE